MIAEAIDTVLTLGWALAAWIVLTALAAALALHTALAIAWWAGRAVFRACGWLYGCESASTPLRAVREPQRSRNASDARTAPRQPADTPHTATDGRHSAPHGAGGDFHAPTPARRPQSRSGRPAPTWVQPDKDAA